MVRHLVFRCPECRSTTNVHALWAKGAHARVACSSCNAAFELAPDLDRGRNDREYYDRIRRYAAENRIDLASAYSVVEGIMAPERARRLPAASPEIPRSPSQPVRAVVLLGTLLIGVLLLSRYLKTPWAPSFPSVPAVELSRHPLERASAVAASPRPPTESGPIFYQMDAESRLVKLSGTDLRAVLSAFCNPEFQTRDLVPYALAPADPGTPLLRVGILREGANGLRSVPISLDARTGRWTIGNGRGPVATEPIATLPAGAENLL